MVSHGGHPVRSSPSPSRVPPPRHCRRRAGANPLDHAHYPAARRRRMPRAGRELGIHLDHVAATPRCLRKERRVARGFALRAVAGSWRERSKSIIQPRPFIEQQVMRIEVGVVEALPMENARPTASWPPWRNPLRLERRQSERTPGRRCIRIAARQDSPRAGDPRRGSAPAACARAGRATGGIRRSCTRAMPRPCRDRIGQAPPRGGNGAGRYRRPAMNQAPPSPTAGRIPSAGRVETQAGAVE